MLNKLYYSNTKFHFIFIIQCDLLMFFKMLNLDFDVYKTSLKLANKSNRRSKDIVLKDLKFYFNGVGKFCVDLRSHI